MQYQSKGFKTLKPCLMVIAALLGLWLSLPVQAFHFPWDQGHDVTDWNDPNAPGPCEGGNCDPCKSTGSPVYVPTGHFIWSETDIVIGGRPPINITRTYNSQDPRDGIFGNGWSSNCEPALTKVVKSDDSISYILRLANGKRYEYIQQADGSIVSPLGRLDKLKADSKGTLNLISQAGGVQKFNAAGQMMQRTDANGVPLNYEYSAQGLITKISSGGRSLQLTYNSNNRVANISDHAGRTWKYAYDTNGNLISVTDPLNGIRKFEYQAFKGTGDGFTYYQLTKITDESGVVVTAVTYNGNRVASYTEGSNKFSYNYNTSSRTVTKTDSLSRVRRYVYNADQIIIQEIDPFNNIDKYEYNADGKITKYTDKQNNTWIATYDSLGRKLSVSTPLIRTTTFQYSGDSPKPVKLVTPLGNTTNIDYDSKLNPIAVTDAKGNQSTLEYDGYGNITATIDAKGNLIKFNYNSFALPIEITDAKGNTMSFGYDNLARKISATDAEGRTTRYEFDSLDRLVKTTNALGHAVIYTYDAAGRILSFADPVGNITQYNYDNFGRLSKETRHDGSFSVYTYNAANLLIRADRYDGKTISFTYDSADRLISNNVGGDIINYVFSARGDLTQVKNGVATINYSYNADGELTSENQAGISISRQFNKDGARTQLTALGLTFTYNRNELNLLSSLVVGSNTFNFSYDANKVLSNISLQNGLNESYNYDSVYNLTQIKTGNNTLDYVRDNTGFITQKSFNGSKINYNYDAIVRLTKAASETYSYDDAGNNTNNGALYDIVTNRLNETSEYTFSYDQAGNLTEKVKKDGSLRKEYDYNARNQLTKVETVNQSNQVLKTLSFTYDPLGRRYSKTENNEIKRYVYDGTGIFAILDGAGKLISSIVNYSIDTPLSITTNDSTYYYHRDHQRSIVALTNSSRTVVESYSYSPYGSTSKSGSTNTGNPYAYTGREFDDSDLYYYRARYYDPTIKRFITEDPINFAGGDYNFYRYVINNPVNNTDSSGLILDTILDVGFVLYDIYRIVKDNIINDCGNLGENLFALGADVVGALVPFATGGGLAVRAGRYADNLVDAARACEGGVCRLGTGLCFVQGTPVHTKEGVKPIEEIKVGDMVLSKDESTGETSWKPVVRLLRNQDKPILNITLVNSKDEVEVIGATPEHPFWIEGNGWIKASQLSKGQQLTTSSGEVLTVQLVEQAPLLHSTFNFEVAEYHTYYVGKDGLLVHNACIDNAIKSAEERAKEIHSVLDPRAQRARTTAVTETQEGVRVVSSSEARLTPAQRAQLGPNEIEGIGPGHAEVTGVNAARDMGLTPTGTAASRPICPNCANNLAGQGVQPLSPLK